MEILHDANKMIIQYTSWQETEWPIHRSSVLFVLEYWFMGKEVDNHLKKSQIFSLPEPEALFIDPVSENPVVPYIRCKVNLQAHIQRQETIKALIQS